MTFLKENRTLFLRTALTLFIVAAAGTLLLSGVFQLTSPVIEETARKKTADAMAVIYPDAVFSPEPLYTDEDAQVYGVSISDVSAGYCVLVEPAGFTAEIFMIVGIDLSGKVTGVKISDMSETVDIGTKVGEAEFLARFKGLSGSASIGLGEGKVEAISGATISSKAVVLGVNQALTAVRDYGLGGNAP